MALTYWTRGSARHPRASESNRASAGAEAGRSSSSDLENFANRIAGNTPQRVLSAIFQDQRDSPGETSAALLDRLALAVGPRNLRAVADEPVVVPLDDSRELVSHCQSLLLGASAAIAVRSCRPWLWPSLTPRRVFGLALRWASAS